MGGVRWREASPNGDLRTASSGACCLQLTSCSSRCRLPPNLGVTSLIERAPWARGCQGQRGPRSKSLRLTCRRPHIPHTSWVPRVSGRPEFQVLLGPFWPAKPVNGRLASLNAGRPPTRARRAANLLQVVGRCGCAAGRAVGGGAPAGTLRLRALHLRRVPFHGPQQTK